MIGNGNTHQITDFVVNPPVILLFSGYWGCVKFTQGASRLGLILFINIHFPVIAELLFYYSSRPNNCDLHTVIWFLLNFGKTHSNSKCKHPPFYQTHNIWHNFTIKKYYHNLPWKLHKNGRLLNFAKRVQNLKPESLARLLFEIKLYKF